MLHYEIIQTISFAKCSSFSNLYLTYLMILYQVIRTFLLMQSWCK